MLYVSAPRSGEPAEPAHLCSRRVFVNLGYHRWAFKPEIGTSRGLGRWTFDGSAGVWFFTQNRVSYPGNSHRSQNPVVTWQGHISHPLVRRSWIALDGTWFAGGQTSIDGIGSPDRQLNARLGVTVAIPIAARQSLKFSYSAGATTRRGSAFDTLNVTWQVVTF